MKRNKYKLIGYIYAVRIIRKCLLMLLFTIFAFSGKLDAQTPQIWPTEISFNYEEGSSNDALTIKKNASTPIAVPEYVKDLRNESCAYIMGQSNRKIRVKFNSNNSNFYYLVRATVISGSGIGNVCEVFVSPCDFNTTEYIITLSGNVPQGIGIKEFTWKWEATALPINSPYCPQPISSVTTTHTFYTLLAEPKAPMTEPWTEVLDIAFQWTGGLSTEDEAADAITEMLYYSGFEYQTSPRYGAGSSFNLTQFLSEYGKMDPSGRGFSVNCVDMGKAVTTFANSVGCNMMLTRFSATQGEFPINCINPIGPNSPPMNFPLGRDIRNDCRQGGFNFHVFAQNINKQIWDATLMYDTDGYPDNVKPDLPCGKITIGHDWKLPLGEPEATYLNRLVDDWVNPADWGSQWVNCSDAYDCGFIYQIEFIIQ